MEWVRSLHGPRYLACEYRWLTRRSLSIWTPAEEHLQRFDLPSCFVRTAAHGILASLPRPLNTPKYRILHPGVGAGPEFVTNSSPYLALSFQFQYRPRP